MILNIHWLSCIFYGVAINTTSSEYTSWVVKYGIMDNSILEKYINSLYWSTTTMASIGYGDITPQNTIERGFVIILMIIASGVYTMLINDVSHIVNNFNVNASKYQ